MGINSHITWGVNWPSNGVSYNRKAGLALHMDLALLVVDVGVSKRGVAQTRVWNETQGFSYPHLKWSAKLLKLTLGLECIVTQTLISQDVELLKLTSNAGLLRPVSEVSMLLEMQGSRFSSKRDLRVEVRLAFDDLSLVMFWIVYRTPPNFLILCGWLGRILKYFGL